jgi:predicted NAD/FAD-dependent oxidoreductase
MATRRLPRGTSDTGGGRTAFDTGGGRTAFDTGGGRTAFDTGAQFFTAVSPEFQALVETAAAEGAITQWYQRPPRHTGDDPLPVWCGSTGMTDFPKWIAGTLHRESTVDVRSSVRVTGIESIPHGIAVSTESGDQGGSHDAINTGSVILTPPVPQALSLLPMDLRSQIDPGIAELDYDPCLALLVSLDSPLRDVFNEYGWFRTSQGDGMIAWGADNARKGRGDHGARNLPRITLHSTAEAARALYQQEDSQVVAELIGGLSTLIPAHARDVLQQARARGTVDLKKWRYARPTRRWRELSARISPRVYLAGDSFGGGRVEGAFVSGRHAAQDLIERSQ